MLRRLFGGGPKAPPGRIPDGQAAYAIGDVHGRLDLLEHLLVRIAEDASRYQAGETRQLVFLGDYIDRGSESRGVVERLLDDPLPGFAKVYLMGNHEDAMLAFLKDAAEPLPAAVPLQLVRDGEVLRASEPDAQLFCAADGALPSAAGTGAWLSERPKYRASVARFDT